MNEQISSKLWVIKYCLKLIYPRYNCYLFLGFLAIKYRIHYNKKVAARKAMTDFELKTVSSSMQRALLREHLETGMLALLEHKCVIISKEQYIQLYCENLFYVDNGVLWVALKLSPELKKHEQDSLLNEKNLRQSLSLVTSEIHKKLWTENVNQSDCLRIVPIVGSKLVEDNVAYTTECEYLNIANTFGDVSSLKVTIHPVPSFKHAPKIATTAQVSLVTNDQHIDSDLMKEVLKNHFEVPKVINENDIFSIELTPVNTGMCYYSYLDVVELGRIHFKCTKVVSNTPKENESTLNIPIIETNKVYSPFYIVKDVTQLSLDDSNGHCKKPTNKYFKICDNTEQSMYLLHACPAGLRHKFEQLQETINPFLTQQMSDLSSMLSNPIIPLILLTGPKGSGKHVLVKSLAKYNGLTLIDADCTSMYGANARHAESKLELLISAAKATAPSIVLLDNFEIFALDAENNEDTGMIEFFMDTITDLYENYTKYSIIFIAVTDVPDLKPNVMRLFLEKIQIPRLNLQERFEMLQWFASAMNLKIDNEKSNHLEIIRNADDILTDHTKEVLQRVAAKTDTFLYGNLDTLMHFALRESYLKQNDSLNVMHSDPDIHVLREQDFDSALESIRSMQSQNLDAPKIPKVYWEDIGGLEKLKKELLKTIEFPIKYPHLFKNSSLKRSGILLYGPPGCGKTLVAKAVSTELNVSFMSVKGPELLNMYVGQSEENVRQVFASARASSPCIIFLDELDALAAKRGAAGDSGGAADRVVSQLLAELDGVSDDGETQSFVFVMGATNRPDLLEQSLLRPGRLDKLIYVGPYVGLYEKLNVMKALCRSHKVSESVQLEALCGMLPARATGADLQAVVSRARAAAVRQQVRKLNEGLLKESELSADSLVLEESHFLEGVNNFRPSVTDEELVYYESLQSFL